jgi:hypothetical protein
MSWTADDEISSVLFEILLRLQQLDPATRFSETGSWKMHELAFFNNTAGEDMNRANAQFLAHMIDDQFVNNYLASYRPGEDSFSAVSKLANSLYNSDNTISNISGQAATLYDLSGWTNNTGPKFH